MLSWVPARLLMIGYAMAGNFEKAIAAWRDQPPGPAGHSIEQLLGMVGRSAADHAEGKDIPSRARVAIDLVSRTL